MFQLCVSISLNSDRFYWAALTLLNKYAHKHLLNFFPIQLSQSHCCSLFPYFKIFSHVCITVLLCVMISISNMQSVFFCAAAAVSVWQERWNIAATCWSQLSSQVTFRFNGGSWLKMWPAWDFVQMWIDNFSFNNLSEKLCCLFYILLLNNTFICTMQIISNLFVCNVVREIFLNYIFIWATDSH